jgi:hypothetical protein
MNGSLYMKRRTKTGLLVVKFYETHPILSVSVVVLAIMAAGVIGWLLGGSRSPSLSYAKQAGEALWLDSFGGEQVLRDATEINEDLLRFSNKYDRFDVAATSLFNLATSYRPEVFETILRRPNGRVRILVLDPRLGFDQNTKLQFETLASQFGDPPQLTLAECLASTFALARLKNGFKSKYEDRFQVRFYRNPYDKGVLPGHFLLGRSYQKYSSLEPTRRFDIIIPYDNPSEVGRDSPHRQAWRIKDRADNTLVVHYRDEFEAEWSSSVPLEEVLRGLSSSFPLPSAIN